jgi:RNA-splicing ligase RtcB
VIEGLAREGLELRAHGYREVSEEAPGAYKGIEA